MKKKINKILKLTLLLCMMFTELASPIKVLADQIIPTYEFNLELEETVDKYIVTSTASELNATDEYILEVIRTFKYADGSTYESENTTEYIRVLGSELTTGVELTHHTFSYNGISNIEVNIYEILDKDIDLDSFEGENRNNLYQELLLDTTKTNKISDNLTFEEGISYNNDELIYQVSEENTNVTCQEDKCIVNEEMNPEILTNNVIVDYSAGMGNANPNKTYNALIYINDELFDVIDNKISFGDLSITLDFSKLLKGTYNVRVDIKESKTNNLLLTSKLTFEYNAQEVDYRTYFDGVTDEYGFISYTALTELEKDELGKDYRFFDNFIAYIFDASLENTELTSDYNFYDNDTRYHILTSKYFVGSFDEEEEHYTVSDLLTTLNSLGFTNVTFSIVDKDGQIVANNRLLENKMTLKVNYFGKVLTYDLLVKWDVDGNLVETSDLSSLIDKLLNNNITFYDKLTLDFNTDDTIDVKDASVLGCSIFFKEYTYEEKEITDTISQILSSNKESVRVGDTFEVTLAFNGFNQNNFNAIESYVDYDNTALRLDKIETLNTSFVGNYKDNRFMYATTSSYNDNDAEFVKLTFTALTEGNTNVSLKDTTLVSDGNLVNVNASNKVTISVARALHTDATIKSLTPSVGTLDKEFNSYVYVYTLYVDSNVTSVTINGILNDQYAKTTDFKEYALTSDNTTITINVTAENNSVLTYKINVVKVYKSSNTNLKELTIDGYEIEFDKDTLEYTINVGSDVDSLDISALVEDAKSWAKIEGNENFSEGKNEVLITVYAEDGTTKTYKLTVNKAKKISSSLVVEDDDTTEATDNTKTEKTIIIILIVLVVIGLLYLIFKTDDEEEPKIEQIKPKEKPKKNNNRK